jgi:hypothetical protein
VKRIISGVLLAIQDLADHAARSITIEVWNVAVADQNVSLIASVVASLRYGIWYLLNITRALMGTSLLYLSQILIPEWA